MTAFADPSEVAEAKARIRAAVLATRRSVPTTARETADAAVLAALTTLSRGARAPRTVAAYAPMKDEPGGTDLPHAVVAAGVARLLLPVLRDDLDLDWAEYAGPDSLVTSERGMREPLSPRLGVTAIGEAELVVVPALSVDSTGIRLGRGGGSYDRALAHVPASTPVVALLYDGELVDRLPAEPHDRPVGGAITPSSGIVHLPTAAGRAAGG